MKPWEKEEQKIKDFLLKRVEIVPGGQKKPGEKVNLSQFASAYGLDPQHIYNLIKKDTNVGYKHILKIITAVGGRVTLPGDIQELYPPSCVSVSPRARLAAKEMIKTLNIKHQCNLSPSASLAQVLDACISLNIEPEEIYKDALSKLWVSDELAVAAEEKSEYGKKNKNKAANQD